MAAPFIVHQSHIKCYLECRQKEHYRYREQIERRRRPAPLVRGTIIHKMVELQSNKQDPFIAIKDAAKTYGKMFAEEREEYGDLLPDITRLMTGYFDWYKRDPLTPIKIGKKSAEHDFSVELSKGIILEGRIDRFVTARDGRTMLEDTKSHKQLPKGDINYSDIQTMLYAWATPQQYKIKLDAIAWNYIRYKPPAIPEQLKNKELTRRNIDTLWPVYLEEIKRHKLDPKDYEDMRERLEGNEASFFVRSYVPVHKTIINNVVDQARQVSQEMRSGLKPVRTIGRHCDWCEYSALCQAEFRGLDVKEMRKRDFQQKKVAETATTEE